MMGTEVIWRSFDEDCPRRVLLWVWELLWKDDRLVVSSGSQVLLSLAMSCREETQGEVVGQEVRSRETIDASRLFVVVPSKFCEVSYHASWDSTLSWRRTRVVIQGSRATGTRPAGQTTAEGGSAMFGTSYCRSYHRPTIQLLLQAAQHMGLDRTPHAGVR